MGVGVGVGVHVFDYCYYFSLFENSVVSSGQKRRKESTLPSMQEFLVVVVCFKNFVLLLMG